MNFYKTLFVAAVTLPLSAAIFAESVTFKARAYEVGMKFSVNEKTGMNMPLQARSKEGAVIAQIVEEQENQTSYVIEVLKVKDGEILAARIDYGVVQKIANTNGNKKTENGAAHKRSYLVKCAGKKGTFTTLDGRSVSADEIRVLESRLAGVCGGSRFTDSILGKTYEVGKEALDVDKALGSFGKQGMGEMKFVLKELRSCDGEMCAVFSVVGSGSEQTEGGAQMSVEFTGEAVVTVHGGWLMSLHLGGPFRMRAKRVEGNVEMFLVGDGKMHTRLEMQLMLKNR